jgi:hypothetical protein
LTRSTESQPICTCTHQGQAVDQLLGQLLGVFLAAEAQVGVPADLALQVVDALPVPRQPDLAELPRACPAHLPPTHTHACQATCLLTTLLTCNDTPAMACLLTRKPLTTHAAHGTHVMRGYGAAAWVLYCCRCDGMALAWGRCWRRRAAVKRQVPGTSEWGVTMASRRKTVELLPPGAIPVVACNGAPRHIHAVMSASPRPRVLA